MQERKKGIELARNYECTRRSASRMIAGWEPIPSRNIKVLANIKKKYHECISSTTNDRTGVKITIIFSFQVSQDEQIMVAKRNRKMTPPGQFLTPNQGSKEREEYHRGSRLETYSIDE
jgi:hypothetical protein